MDWPISQLVTDPCASSQEKAGHALLKHVPCGDKVGAKVTANGLVVLATTEDELERAIDTLQQVVPGLKLWKPQLNYIFGNPLLEPYAAVVVEVPRESAARVLDDLRARRAKLKSETEYNGVVRVEAEVPMSELFGYSTSLRSITRSSATFKQEFSGYEPGPGINGTDYADA